MTSYLARTAAAPLDAAVRQLWTSARSHGLAHDREWNLPTGLVDLVLPLDRPALRRFDGLHDTTGHWLAGGVLQGAMDRPVLRCTAHASVVVGAQLQPGGLALLMGWPADEIAGQTLALDAVWPGWAERLREQVHHARALHDAAARLALFEQALHTQLRPAARADALVLWAWPRLAAGTPVGVLQRASGLAPATFIRRFRAASGLAPQRQQALQRFQAALAAGQQGLPWVEAALQAGYADQPHLSRELRRFAGHSPGQIRRQATAWAQHLAAD